MASGNPVVQILAVMPPATSFATVNVINGGSSPAERSRVWTFPVATSAYMDYLCALKGYTGGGLTLRLGWSTAATGGNVVWQAAIRRIVDDAEDMDTSHSYDYNTVTAAAPSAVNEVGYDNITFTNGADMDSWAEDEMAIIRIFRDPANGSDNADTAHLWGFLGYET